VLCARSAVCGHVVARVSESKMYACRSERSLSEPTLPSHTAKGAVLVYVWCCLHARAVGPSKKGEAKQAATAETPTDPCLEWTSSEFGQVLLVTRFIARFSHCLGTQYRRALRHPDKCTPGPRGSAPAAREDDGMWDDDGDDADRHKHEVRAVLRCPLTCARRPWHRTPQFHTDGALCSDQEQRSSKCAGKSCTTGLVAVP
jgi:hypothetical protein